jgi:hypothetical protein
LGLSQGFAWSIRQKEIEEQNGNFKRCWEHELVWRYDDLPTQGSVPGFRIPYSGYIYPDGAGGTNRVLHKYDLAFHRGRSRTVNFELADIAVHQQPQFVRRGLFGFRGGTVMGTPSWHGHCNGWTAAAIRHAEPQHTVTRNGVQFTPSDIKGLLAEMYGYSETIFLGGRDYVVHPGTLHVILANWIGRQNHPVAMETTPGRVVWNYPVYAYKTSSVKRNGGRQVEVTMKATFAMSTNREYDKPQPIARTKYFHYVLDLNATGEIVVGRFYGDSSQIDMLWTPLPPVQGGKKGNEQGNPHLDIKEVLALWRESVAEDIHDKWVNVAPAAEPPSGEPTPPEPLVAAAANTAPAARANANGGSEAEPAGP